MPKSVKIDNGDIVLANKRLALVDDNEQKIQQCEGLLQINKGELFFNADVGLDFIEVFSIDEKLVPIGRRKLAINEALFQSEYTKEVENINIIDNAKDRSCKINFEMVLNTDEVVGGGVEIV